MVHQPKLPLKDQTALRPPSPRVLRASLVVAPERTASVTRAPRRRASWRGDDWRLDDRTRRAGRQGLASARAALARAQARASTAA